MRDNIASHESGRVDRDGVEGQSGLTDDLIRGVVNERARGSALGMGRDASRFLDAESLKIQKLTTAKQDVIASLVDLLKIREVAQVDPGSGINDERKIAVIHRAAVVQQDLAQARDLVEIGAERRSSSGAETAGSAAVNHLANVGLDVIPNAAHRLGEEVHQHRLIPDGVLQLTRHGTSDRQGGDSGLTHCHGLNTDRLVVARRQRHGRGVGRADGSRPSHRARHGAAGANTLGSAVD